MARPSLKPHTPRGSLVVLKMKGLLKMGLLRTSMWDASSNFAKPTLTLSQKPKMLFQNEHFVYLSLGATKSQFMSGMFGPLRCTERWTWFVWCFRISLFNASKSFSKVLLRQVLSLKVWHYWSGVGKRPSITQQFTLFQLNPFKVFVINICFNFHKQLVSQPYFGQVWGWSPTLGKSWDWSCRNPSIWLATKARRLRGCEPRSRPESHITCSRECKECKECKECEGVNPHTPKW
jgi:hypothetical protein